MNSSDVRILVIDTTDSVAIAEAWAGESKIAAESFGAARHAQALTGKIQSLLARAVWRTADIQAIAVNLGPGSFTGIRVGLATAKALVYVHQFRLIGVDCFDAIAASVALPSFQVLLPGQLGTYHTVTYELEGGVRVRRPLQTLHRDVLVTKVIQTGATFTTKGCARQLANIGLNYQEALPQVGPVALAKWKAGISNDPMLLEPFYVRPSSAEVAWDARPTKT